MALVEHSKVRIPWNGLCKRVLDKGKLFIYGGRENSGN